ncbi:oxidoreductase [Gordonia neofelifaecis]|uniref:Short-chain dehydrogenase/reductase SDR n=1 Tax=Gordonia neofelifaecis NRRL B-59395 TaxID=644548 RepID=F1YGY3_9ACTN|nr:oxidoreductase [Gordonia neofelifaecis]EGD56281.1 short-chain dehydrogenase/reductase SDR [Gordonia neofelifaecis NRRL B-59395]
MPKRRAVTPWTIDDASDQSGRIAIVTGANSGIGFEVARGLVQLGATVVMACRNERTAADARGRLVAECPGADVSVVPLDLANAESIRRCADMITAERSTIDIVVANAGYIPTAVVRDADGVESAFAATFLGHFALIGLLRDGLLNAPAARVVTVGSLAHRSKALDPTRLGVGTTTAPMRAYAEAKLAQLIFAQELDRRLTAAGPSAISLAAHPGAARTGVMRERPRIVQRIYHSRLAWPLLRWFINDARTGALPVLRAATDRNAVGGEYFGPSGPFELTGAPVPVPSIPVVRNAAVGARLWKFAEQYTGIAYP